MSPPPDLRFTALAFRPHLPRRTVRLRLALLYGCVFIACGAALLALTYLLVVAQAAAPRPICAPVSAGASPRSLRGIGRGLQPAC